MNKRTTKTQTKCQRRYPSGILMYRERKNTFTVDENTLVGIVKHGSKQTLVKLPKQHNGWLTVIDNENLPAFRAAIKSKGKGGNKGKGSKAGAPVVAGEPVGVGAAEIETAGVETAPVVTAETAVAPVAEPVLEAVI